MKIWQHNMLWCIEPEPSEKFWLSGTKYSAPNLIEPLETWWNDIAAGQWTICQWNKGWVICVREAQFATLFKLTWMGNEAIKKKDMDTAAFYAPYVPLITVTTPLP